MPRARWPARESGRGRAAVELAEKLVVEIVEAGQHHQRRALHRGMPHRARGEEEAGETLAAPFVCQTTPAR